MSIGITSCMLSRTVMVLVLSQFVLLLYKVRGRFSWSEARKTAAAEKAKREEFAHEDEALRTTFTTILDQGLRELQAERKRKLEEAKKMEKSETELREVSVLFEDEEGVFRISDASYTFDSLQADACRFFHSRNFLLIIYYLFIKSKS